MQQNKKLHSLAQQQKKKKTYLNFMLLFYIAKSASYLKKEKWKFANLTIYLNLQNIEVLQKSFDTMHR